MYEDPSKVDEGDSSDSDWEVEKFEGSPQEYLEMLKKREEGYVSEEVRSLCFFYVAVCRLSIISNLLCLSFSLSRCVFWYSVYVNDTL